MRARWSTGAMRLSETDYYKGAYPDPLTGWFDWGDEYWTVYPDGVAVRKQVLWSSHLDGISPGNRVVRTPRVSRRSIVLNGPGQWPGGQYQPGCPYAGQHERRDADVLVGAQSPGDLSIFRTGPTAFRSPKDANIQWINLKSTWKPFQVAPAMPSGTRRTTARRPTRSFEWWNHWPVAQIPSSGRPALAPDRASHTSLSHIYWPVYEQTDQTITKILMDGLTDKPAAELVPLAKSWLKPAPIEVSGARNLGYDSSQRAYVLMGEGASTRATIALKGSPESPLVNPAVVIRNWSGGTRVTGANVRTGRVQRLEGTDLVIFIETHSTGTVRINVEP